MSASDRLLDELEAAKADIEMLYKSREIYMRLRTAIGLIEAWPTTPESIRRGCMAALNPIDHNRNKESV